jgi:hypothetical protein
VICKSGCGTGMLPWVRLGNSPLVHASCHVSWQFYLGATNYCKAVEGYCSFTRCKIVESTSCKMFGVRLRTLPERSERACLLRWGLRSRSAAELSCFLRTKCNIREITAGALAQDEIATNTWAVGANAILLSDQQIYVLLGDGPRPGAGSARKWG